jgi:Cu/Ag efflux protein CusF
MKRFLNIFTLAAITLSSAAVSRAQSSTAPARAAATARASQHLVGEVTAVDASGGQITVKTDAGSSVNVVTNEKTIYRRIPPGQTSLANAETITRADVHAGDRVLMPSGASGARGAARQVIVMAREAIASKRAQEQQDWRARGVRGRVAALDAGRKEITVESRSREGAEKVTVAADGNARFLRYAPDSQNQVDAVPGAFADIRVGDEIRVLGNRDGARVTAEQVVSGSVTRLTGTIESVDAARNELTVRDASGKIFNVAVGAHTTLRRMTAEAAQALAQRADQRRGESAGQPGQNGSGDREGRRGNGGDGAGRQRGFGGGRQGMFGNLPATKLAELKKGDGVIITATPGADAAHVTASSLVAGDAELVQRMQQRFRRGPGAGQRGAGTPGGGPGEGGGSPDRP